MQSYFYFLYHNCRVKKEIVNTLTCNSIANVETNGAKNDICRFGKLVIKAESSTEY